MHMFFGLSNLYYIHMYSFGTWLASMAAQNNEHGKVFVVFRSVSSILGVRILNS